MAQSASDSTFCLTDYDIVGFDMDHTLVQYHLPEVFKLIYTSAVEYLKGKNYGEFLHGDNFEKYEDFSLRGLVFDCVRGNFIKLRKDGYIFSCSHGLTEMSSEEIMRAYGAQRIWSKFDSLKETVSHSEGFAFLETFFLMPAAPLIGQIIEQLDKKNGVLSDYTHIWRDVISALSLNFQAASFKDELGSFFPSIKRNPSKYVKKCPASVIRWIEKLRKNKQIIVLITNSYGDFAEFIMSYTFSSKWRDSFDYITVAANKPLFFQDEFKDRPFVELDMEHQLTNVDVTDLRCHTCYARGHANFLEQTLKSHTGKKSLKTVYFGDSLKSDVFPPNKFLNWDTVAVLEELEAEEIHFHKNNFNTKDLPNENRIPPLLKEEKLLISSTQWGSFFTHNDDNGNLNDTCNPLNTFCGQVIASYSKIAIPLLDYITGNDLSHKYAAFSQKSDGFYPSKPRSLGKDECT